MCLQFIAKIQINDRIHKVYFSAFTAIGNIFAVYCKDNEKTEKE